MTYLAKPKLHHPSLDKNALGFTRRDYEGRMSTLCAGCGHDSISASIIQACFEIDLPPHRLRLLRHINHPAPTRAHFLQQFISPDPRPKRLIRHTPRKLQI